MRKKIGFFGLAVALLLLPSAGVAQQAIRWEVTLENAQRVAAQSNRLVLITFWTQTCVYCKRMEAEVLSQPSVAAEVMANYVPVKINADYFPATAKQYGVTHLPTTVITTPQGQVLNSFEGRVEAADYVARLNLISAEVKRRGNPAFAQVSAGTVSSVPTQAAPTQAAPAQVPTTPPASTQTPSSGVPGDRYSSSFRRDQATPSTPIAQPSTPSTAPSGVPSLPNYAQPVPNYTQPAPNYAQPAPNYTQPAPNYAQPAPNYAQSAPNYAQPSPTNAPPASPLLPTNRSAQPYPPSRPPMNSPMVAQQSPTPAAAQPAYGAQSAPPLVRQPTNPSPAVASPQPSTANQPFGLDGYCAVSLLERQQWVPGDSRWGVTHRGRTYLFAGAEEQRRFWADPDRYAPVVAGNDIVLAAEQGQTVSGMREHGVFFGSRVYLFSSEATLDKFARNPNLYANQALEALRSGAYPGRQLR